MGKTVRLQSGFEMALVALFLSLSRPGPPPSARFQYCDLLCLSVKRTYHPLPL
jgi:hypothetical protein